MKRSGDDIYTVHMVEFSRFYPIEKLVQLLQII